MRARLITICAALILLVGCALVARTVWTTPHGTVSHDTNQYATALEAYARTGEARIEAYREPVYQWVVFALGAPFIEPGGGWTPTLRQKATLVVATVQTALYWAAIAALALLIWRTAGLPALATFTLLVGADNYDYQWIPTIMSEPPAKIAFLTAVILLAGYANDGDRRKALSAMLLVGLCPLFRSPEISLAIALGTGGVVYALLAFRRRRLVLALAALGLLLTPTALHIAVFGATKGFYGMSPLSAWMMSGRVNAVTDPDALVAAGLDRGMVDNVARRVFEPDLKTAIRVLPVANDLSQPDGIYKREFPQNYRKALVAITDYRKARGLPEDRFLASNELRKFASASARAVPGPMIETTLDLWWQHAFLPLLRNVQDHSVTNKLRVIFYLSIPIALIWLIAWRKTAPPLAWGWMAASFIYLPVYSLLFATIQNYLPKYGNHPYLFMGLMAFMAVYSAWVHRRRTVAN
jgi:hypothetical protein